MDEIEAFRHEADTYQAFFATHQPETTDANASDDGALSDELNSLRHSLNVLAGQLQLRNAQVLPNQSVILERTLKEHKVSGLPYCHFFRFSGSAIKSAAVSDFSVIENRCW